MDDSNHPDSLGTGKDVHTGIDWGQRNSGCIYAIVELQAWLKCEKSSEAMSF
jgi:hypothetical protein